MMNEARIKHLELIQGVVTRHQQNSFASRGWVVTLLAAVLALSAKEANPLHFLVALIPTVVFWGLDGYYLRQERLFRKLYDNVRTIPADELENNPFSMDTLPYTFRQFAENMPAAATQVATWCRTCWSKTIGWLYGSLVATILAAFLLAFALR